MSFKKKKPAFKSAEGNGQMGLEGKGTARAGAPCAPGISVFQET